MINRFARQLRDSERGATMVEFAIVATLLFALIFGIIEFGWIFNGYVTLTSAAQEGARLAIVMEVVDEGEIRKTVKEHARIFKLNDSDILINAAVAGGEREVIVNGELDLLIAFPPLPSSINLQSSATMRQER